MGLTYLFQYTWSGIARVVVLRIDIYTLDGEWVRHINQN